MNTVPPFDPALLIGTWRLIKIQWHDKTVTHITSPDMWSDYTFKPDGILEIQRKAKDGIEARIEIEKWRVEKDKIFVTSFGKDHYEVERLTDIGLVLKFLNADVRKGWRRVGE